MKDKKKHGLFYKLAGIGNIKMGFEHTKDMFKTVTDKNPDNYVVESFDEALERGLLKLNIPKEKAEQHLINVYGNLKFITLFFGIAAVLLLIIGMIPNLYHGKILPSLVYLSLCSFFLIYATYHAFRCYQIRYRRLGHLKEWIATPKEWYPVSLKKVWNK